MIHIPLQSQIDANESSVKQGTGDWMQQESQGLSSLLFATTLFGHRAEVPGELPVALFTAQQFANLGHPEQVPTLDSARPSKGQVCGSREGRIKYMITNT